jgi:hypothetical protein
VGRIRAAHPDVRLEVRRGARLVREEPEEIPAPQERRRAEAAGAVDHCVEAPEDVRAKPTAASTSSARVTSRWDASARP